MGHIFIGFLLIFLNFDINLNQYSIGLLPDFIGYVFLCKGITELNSESALFMKVRSLCIGMGLYTGILYAFNLFGFKPQLGWIGPLLGFISTMISLYISYAIVCGVQEMEVFRSIDLNGNKLRSTWTYMAICQVAVWPSLLVPGLAFILVIISAIISIVFLIEFSASKNLYTHLVQ